jgi:hypothetical protein
MATGGGKKSTSKASKPAAKPAATAVYGGYSGIPTTKTTPNFSQTLNLYGTPTQSTRTTATKKPVSTKKGSGTQPKVGKETGATNTFIPGIVSLGDSGGDTGGGENSCCKNNYISYT